MAANSMNEKGNKARHRRETEDALRAYAKVGQLKPDTKNLLNLIDDESDRGAVVIVGSIIEDPPTPFFFASPSSWCPVMC